MIRMLLGWRATAPLMGVLLVLFVLASSAAAQGFKVLFNFDGEDGGLPIASTLVQGVDGNLYGTTDWEGASGYGTVFKVTPAGVLTKLYDFCQNPDTCTDGANPVSGLVLGPDGNFYGTTIGGGTFGAGTVYKITPSGVLTTLYSFVGPEGAFPATALVLGSNGNFYGTTSLGGNSAACPGLFSGCGSIFEITSTGEFTLLHLFDLNDGATPQAPLVQASDGNFYGTAFQGGSLGYGTVFKMTPSGALALLHSFSGADGEYPSGSLLQEGNVFYGTAAFGGSNGYGTVFEMTHQGVLRTIFNFDLGNGYVPSGAIIRAADGYFYGSTESGGPGACGTLFRFNAAGTLTVLHDFALEDGCYPNGQAQGTNGIFYGLGYGGGAHSYGTVFSFSAGLRPLVETAPASGKVGTSVQILGTNLRGATSVTFNRTAASFTVVSGTLITATVPAGATTGIVKVVTPRGTLSSNLSFQVIQ